VQSYLLAGAIILLVILHRGPQSGRNVQTATPLMSDSPPLARAA
jgi:hypothetical protein